MSSSTAANLTPAGPHNLNGPDSVKSQCPRISEEYPRIGTETASPRAETESADKRTSVWTPHCHLSKKITDYLVETSFDEGENLNLLARYNIGRGSSSSSKSPSEGMLTSHFQTEPRLQDIIKEYFHFFSYSLKKSALVFFMLGFMCILGIITSLHVVGSALFNFLLVVPRVFWVWMSFHFCVYVLWCLCF